jgi:hypothetical protein
MAKKLPIVITTINRTRKSIRIGWTQGDASFDLDETDNPLPAFNLALTALDPLVSVICHLPPAYSKTDIRINGLIIGSKGGADTVVLDVRKGLDYSAKEWKFKTPERLLAQPEEEGTYSPPLKEEEAALVFEMIEQAKAYVRGERAQGVLPILNDGEEDDPAVTAHAEDQKQANLIELPPQEKPAGKTKGGKKDKNAGK